jgi:hypothetical protein
MERKAVSVLEPSSVCSLVKTFCHESINRSSDHAAFAGLVEGRRTASMFSKFF